MKSLFLVCCFSLTVHFCYSQTLDPEYTTKFGYGIVLASLNGYPELAKYNADQFNFKENVFYLPPGEGTTLNLRMILPKATTIASHMNKLLKEKPQNLKHKQAEYTVWQIWCSHSAGINQVKKWPVSKTDEPKWSAPCAEIFYNYNAAENGNWVTSGVTWDGEGENLKSKIGYELSRAQPGYRYYVIYRVAYEYSVPGGQTENKWNDVLKKWEPVVSTGGIGYVYSDPIACCTIEIGAYENQEGRFIDNGDGTVTDTKTNLMWLKEPPKREEFWKDANQKAEDLDFAGFSDWRLPTAAEMKELWLCSKAMDKENDCTWINSNGFANVVCAAYWTSDFQTVDGIVTTKRQIFDFYYKTYGGQEENYNMNYWPVRTK